MHEMRTLTECMHEAACYDQLNLPTLAAFESLFRRVHSIVDAWIGLGPRLGGSPDPSWIHQPGGPGHALFEELGSSKGPRGGRAGAGEG